MAYLARLIEDTDVVTKQVGVPHQDDKALKQKVAIQALESSSTNQFKTYLSTAVKVTELVLSVA